MNELKLKLINKEVKTDPNTFSPMLKLTVEIPLESIKDCTAFVGEMG